MKHKWHKEIKAWADGAEIQVKNKNASLWSDDPIPFWDSTDYEFRIKPQPKEPQYLYVYQGFSKTIFTNQKEIGVICSIKDKKVVLSYAGKIKLEQDDD